MKELTPFFVLLINLFFPLVHSHSNNDFPLDTCSIEKRSCEIHKDNLIETFTVNTKDECRQRCEYLENCQYLSYFGTNNFPVVNYCMLFSNCSILEYCGEDCYTEDIIFCDSCGRNFESTLGDNVIEWIPDVEEDWNCRGLCLEDAGCLYFTYYKKESEHLPNLCILLSDLGSSFQECEHCVTSIPDCGNTSYISCKFTIDSNQTLLDSHIITNTYHAVNVTFSPSASLACEATVIAVGGGGYLSYGGGGSGYVMSDVIDVSSTDYQASVGQGGQDSVFKIKNGQNIITAQAGGDGTSNNSGDGYSGGGGYGNGHAGYNGGSDGSNGDGTNGGSGSGLNISTISLKYHMLNPGNGGEHSESYGGGGGGVLVDNVGPSPSTIYNGQGYGGGGGYGRNAYGFQGMILIETRSKT